MHGGSREHQSLSVSCTEPPTHTILVHLRGLGPMCQSKKAHGCIQLT
jgi:hypothetical protein